MINYVPRPGSKTEAAASYLRAHGGRATAIDIAEAIDAERKNLPALFAAAIAGGYIEACELPDGKGYALRDATAKPKSPAPTFSAAAPAGSESAAAAKPKLDPPKRRGRGPGKLKVPKALIVADRKRQKARPVERTPLPPPKADACTFRCGFFSDGTLRLEGLDKIHGGPAEVTLSPESARVLTDYLRSQP